VRKKAERERERERGRLWFAVEGGIWRERDRGEERRKWK
jgi:hypothetical protein